MEKMNENIVDEYGVVYSADGRRLLHAPKDLKSYAVKPGTEEICDRAFEYCTSLAKIEIPISVVEIGDYAFWYCTGLKEIEIPRSVRKIGDYAFWYCKGLKEIEIPSSVECIGKRAFEDCNGLGKIVIPGSFGYLFRCCRSLAEITVVDGKDNRRYDSRGGCNAIINSETN